MKFRPGPHLSLLLALLAPFSLLAQGQPTEAPMEAPTEAPAAEPSETEESMDATKPEADAPKKEKKPKKPFAPDISSSKPGAPKVRLFILSGQSNMQGLNPAKSFTPAVVAAFPDDDVVVVKDAQSGQPIRRWLKDWKPAEGVESNKKAKGVGDLYVRLTSSIATALEGKPTPESIVFVWMQGEADAKGEWSANNYDKSLLDLVNLLRTDLKAPNMPAVIGHLSDHTPANPTVWATVKAKQEAAVKSDPRMALVNTDDLNGPKNGLHYDGAGYKELGQRFADAAIKLLKEPK